MSKKYYWLRLKKDFFKRHDIQIIEAMQNGKDYILFYLKMLVESVDHEGDLRFSDTIPYNDSMLSTITNTNVDIVRSAMKVFTELGMIEVLDNQTIHMAEVQKLLGKETYWAEQKRKQRVGQCPMPVQLVQPLSNQEIEIEIESDIDIKSIGKNPRRFAPPSLTEVTNYCLERKNSIDPQKFIDYYQANGWMVGKSKMKDWRAAIRNWESRQQNNSPALVSPKNQNFKQNTIASMQEDEMKAIIERKAQRRINEQVKANNT